MAGPRIGEAILDGKGTYTHFFQPEVSSETIFNFWVDRCLLGAKATLWELIKDHSLH